VPAKQKNPRYSKIWTPAISYIYPIAIGKNRHLVMARIDNARRHMFPAYSSGVRLHIQKTEALRQAFKQSPRRIAVNFNRCHDIIMAHWPSWAEMLY
jgi:hypothetical protein